MARFPKREAKVATLASDMINSLTENAEFHLGGKLVCTALFSPSASRRSGLSWEYPFTEQVRVTRH